MVVMMDPLVKMCVIVMGTPKKRGCHTLIYHTTMLLIYGRRGLLLVFLW